MPDEREAIADAIASSPAEARARPHDRRHGPRAARRHARGDARRARPLGAGHRPGDARRRDLRRRRTPCSRAASRAIGDATLVVNLPGSPGGCRDGFAVLAAGAASPTRSSSCAGRRQTACHRADVTSCGLARRSRARFARLVKIEHTVFALPFAYVGAFLAVGGMPVGARPPLDHARDGRRPLARDGAQPAHRRAHRRAQPAHGGARAAERRALASSRSRSSARRRSRSSSPRSGSSPR